MSQTASCDGLLGRREAFPRGRHSHGPLRMIATSIRITYSTSQVCETEMQVAVIGAGAVGCYYGGQLLRAGHQVMFIGRQPHVDAINAHGLLLETQAFEGRLPAKAAIDSSSLAQPDLVLFCVKSADTEAAGRSLAGKLHPRTPILSLQNGVDNPQRLSR